jgi:hypothetical protein
MWRQSLWNDLSTRMRDLVTVAAQFVDPKIHASLRVPADMESEGYKKLRASLIAVRKSVPDIRFLYTFRKVEGQKDPVFVLDTGDVGSDFSALGDVYESPTATLLASLEPPYMTRVEPALFSDKWGTWLSAFAPILDGNGRLEGILGMDMSAAYVNGLEARLFITILALASAIVSAY